MASDLTVGDLVTLQRGLTYKGNLVGKPGPALLGLGSITPGGGFRDDYKTYGGECPPHLMLGPGDLYASLKGATKDGEMIGSVARIPPDVSSGRLTQDTVGLKFRENDPQLVSHLYWTLRTPQYRDYCRGRARGSAVVALSREDFLGFPVPPRSPIRTLLVDLFDNVERKIELNRRMNATLEAMARALFQSWFVDFDPVRAKAAGQTPAGMDPATAALFPSEFEDSELGEIPKGWRVKTLDDLAHVAIGKTPPRKEHHWFTVPPDGMPWVSIRDMGQAGVFIFDTAESLTPEAVQKHRVKAVPAGTVLLSFKLTVGRVSIATREMLTNEAIAHLPLKDTTSFNAHYLYLYLSGFAFDKLGSTSSIATAVNSDTIRSLPVLVPTKPVCDCFAGIVRSLFDQIKAADQQSRTLAALRDALLPKLLSGELTMANAERFVVGSGSLATSNVGST